MATKQLPLVVSFAEEEGRLPLPLKIALGDHLVELIGAGTKVPTQREVEISNAEDNQESLTIRVMQGASNRLEANAPVGTYKIAGLPPAPKGTLSITLTLDVTPSLGFNLLARAGDQECEIDLLEPGRPLGQKAIMALLEEEDRDEPVAFSGTYDDAKYHRSAVADEELDAHQAYVHTGMFVGWLVDNELIAANVLAKSTLELGRFRARQMTGPQLYKQWGGVLHQDMLTDAGNHFARCYFDFDKGRFLGDYQTLLAPEGATLFDVEDSWPNYDKLVEKINTRFQEANKSDNSCKGSTVEKTMSSK